MVFWKRKKESQIWDAIEGGDVARVAQMLDGKEEIDHADERGRTPLTWAAAHGQYAVAKLLLDRGANVHHRSPTTGACALGFASMQGHAELVTLLLDRGADVDAYAARFRKAHLSLRLGSIVSLDALNLPMNPDTPGRPVKMAVPLVLAAEKGHVRTMIVLLSRGADIDARVESGETAIVQAAQEGRLEAVRVLLDEGANINSTADDGSSALTRAAEYGHLEIVLLLLANRADVKQLAAGSSARRHAEHNGHWSIVKALDQHH